jgi:uncharacterized membrane protein (DUF4010 family)
MERELALRLAVALALGLVVGLERGWRSRDVESGVRNLGMRSFGLAGLLGGVIGSLADGGGPWVLGLGFAGIAGFAALTYSLSARATGDYGATTELALLVTFALGALAATGREVEAAGAAVGTALLLSSKARLHAFVAALDERELTATLQLLLVATVAIPLLPNRALGPYGAVNPRAVGWLVLLISGVSFAGYVAVKLLGGRRGTLVTALFGGLTSSTAVTLAFARAARKHPDSAPLLGAGIGLAAAMMGLRVGVLVSLVAPSLLPWLALPLASLAAVPVVATALARPRSRARSEADSDSLLLRNPLELDVALGWAALIVGLSVLSRALQDWLGDAGLYLLAMASGLADVDAISLSLARMVPESLTPQLAAHLIVLAALANTAAKALLAAVVGGPRLALRGGGILLATLAAGAAAAFFA